MCRFKSGIIFKSRCVVAPGENDSHSDLLREMNIEDTYTNASRLFVRAELVPKNNEWWTDPDGWEFVVDQDVTPDWYDTDPGKYEEEFRQAVKAWWDKHVIVDKKIDELSSGFYRLKRCKVKKLLNDVKVYLDRSTVGEMCGRSTVGEMWGSSTVGKMRDSSTVGKMWDSSTVGEMWGSSTVGEMWGSSTVGKMRNSSTVGKMRNSSTARDFKNYPNVKIHIPKGGKFELVEHEEEKPCD
nr:MAG TPA: hypothetical protein [Caudoviricetes sp.]